MKMVRLMRLKKEFEKFGLMPEAGVTKGGMGEEARSKWKYAHIRQELDLHYEIHNDVIHGVVNADDKVYTFKEPRG
jgi:hypothetical protein